MPRFGTITSRKVYIKWEIENFKDECSTYHNPRNYIDSPIYYLSSSNSCFLRLYLDGTEGHESFLSFYFIAYKGEFNATVSYYILDPANEKSFIKEMRRRTYVAGRSGCGHSRYVKREKLFADETLLPEGRLTIGCEITIDPEMIEDMQVQTHCSPKTSLIISQKMGQYEELFLNPIFSDVKFIVEGQEISVHKSIIAVNCSVFRVMFESQMKELDEDIVRIDDIPYQAMYELLRFIYTGKVENLDALATDILIAAGKYLMEDLKVLCENHLAERLSLENIVEMTNLSSQYNASHLKRKCINYITQHSAKITKSPLFDISKLDADTVRKIFQEMAEYKEKGTNK
ncbi:hypothetical protein QAD02_004435 [Eretmocerus hayati]|uniref:Uncharacterized protein n=1 Tax=Eretmocerus hayati TaxID=131215 RepID=A0ACC2NQU0_9HYME|nr:hypothetical protein QAD02_004435 [Eretmocerus hayati]